eukprot:198110-Pleurochrysis_carterae.AAC.5
MGLVRLALYGRSNRRSVGSPLAMLFRSAPSTGGCSDIKIAVHSISHTQRCRTASPYEQRVWAMAALASVAPRRLARSACGQIEGRHARFAGGILRQMGRSSHSSSKHFRRKPHIACHLIGQCLALAQSRKRLYLTKINLLSQARTTNRVSANTRTTLLRVLEPELHRRLALDTL